MWLNILVIALGGAIGSVLRFFISSGVEGFFKRDYFPVGILACNIIGSFVIGIIAGVILKKAEFSELWRYFLIVGLCGGFTTFSSFSLDNLTLLRQGQISLAFVNIVISVFVCLFVTFIGFALASKV
jgi:CrcB protein